MKKIVFHGSMNEMTGYGNAVYNMAESFKNSNLDVSFSFNHPNFNHGTSGDIHFFLHGPPWPKVHGYKIGYFYWEADSLPITWYKLLNSADELWAPCNLIKNAILKTGFKKKLIIIPTAVRPFESKILDLVILNNKKVKITDSTFKFYSIFQWHERKGFKELLTSYYQSFTPDDNVILILKVNPLNFKGNTIDKIKLDIYSIKDKLKLKFYPPIFLNTNLVSKEYIDGIHTIGDCYVSPHHGEGWGMPIHDAAIKSKNIITTQYGGFTESLDNDSAFIIKHSIGPVNGMSWLNLFYKNQSWAYPSINHLSKLMRQVYDDRDLFKGNKAFNIANSMNIDNISKLIYNELKSGRWK